MQSIKLRFAGGILILVSSIVLFVVSYFPAQQRVQYIEAYEKELDVINETLALGLAIGLRDDNYESLRFAFDFARSDERLVYVLVTDTDNQVIASYPEDLQIEASRLTDNTINGEDILVNQSRIQIEDQLYGSIYMAHSLNQLNEIITTSRNRTLLVGSIILLIGFILAYLVALRLTRPIELLTKATRALTNGDYAVQAPVETRDEAGILATHFNEMAKTIANKTEELEDRAEELTQTIEELEQAKTDIQNAHLETEQLLSSISSVLIEVDRDKLIRRWNVVAEHMFSLSEAEVLGRSIEDLGIEWSLQDIESYLANQETRNFALADDITYKSPDGKSVFLQVTINVVRDVADEEQGYLILAVDVTEKNTLENQLAQAQKLESLGRLAAGIAHEINTPIQYIGDNARFLEVAFKRLDGILDKSKQLVDGFKDGVGLDQLIEEVDKSISASKMEYMRQEIPFAIEESIGGVNQVASIVRAMKQFSHPGNKDKSLNNLNEALVSTINVARNEWKYVADLETDFDEALPMVPSLHSELNQVFLNMIVNAAHAITPTIENKPNKKGTIKISTRQAGDFVEIRIQDNGSGIPEEIQSKVFDPFFTTKEVGKGTGQGLALAYNVIYEKHGGKISLESEVGVGTTFIVSLPVQVEELETSNI